MKNILIDSLRASGDILIGYFEGKLTETEKESQSSIVTEADLESEELIIALITDKYPHHNILSEERGFINNNSVYTWIIDPLDGTSNFASGIPWFGVLITIFRRDSPVMAGAYLPVQDILYFAEAGRGSFRNGERLPQIEEKELKDSLVAFCADYTEDIPFLKKGLEIYGTLVKESRNVRSTNSLIDFLYVAEGRFGGVVNLFTKVWDIAGTGLIITEAGGSIINIDGSDLQFNPGKDIIGVNYPVIAGSRQFIKSFKELILKL